MRNMIPSDAPASSDPVLVQLGASIRAARKAMRISSAATAEVAGISRVTLHRIEKGEPTVTAGAWSRVLRALGMRLSMQTEQPQPAETAGTRIESGQWLPVQVRLADYPQLKALAWQVHGVDVLRPIEAFDIYQRNARFLNPEAMRATEQGLLQALRAIFGAPTRV